MNLMTRQTDSLLCFAAYRKRSPFVFPLQKTLSVGSGFSTLERSVHIFLLLLLVQFKSGPETR